MNTRLYLISPPAIDLPVFRKELEAALCAGIECAQTGAPALSGASCESKEAFAEATFTASFQLRLKNADDADIKKAIRELMPICRANEAAFIINDRPDLCAELKCDGVHVGQEDLSTLSHRERGGASLGEGMLARSAQGSPHPNPLPEGEGIIAIRNLIGENAAIGVTCHASRHLAMEAGEAGADYVAFGAFYETTSKPKEKLEKWGTPTPDILSWWQTFMTLPCVAIGGITPANCKPLAAAGADFLAVITAVWNHPGGAAAAVREFKKELS